VNLYDDCTIFSDSFFNLSEIIKVFNKDDMLKYNKSLNVVEIMYLPIDFCKLININKINICVNHIFIEFLFLQFENLNYDINIFGDFIYIQHKFFKQVDFVICHIDFLRGRNSKGKHILTLDSLSLFRTDIVLFNCYVNTFSVVLTIKKKLLKKGIMQ
jgi:hypothetical protein